MFGQSTSAGANTDAGRRVYKVTISEAGTYAKNKHLTGYTAPIRQGNYTLTIPYDRFLPEMMRIHATGANIVSVTAVVS